MNLDDIKNLHKDVTLPGDASAKDTHLAGFIAKLRARDQREIRRLRGKTLFYLSIGLVFATASMGLQPSNKVIGVGFILVALYAGLKVRWFGQVEYGASAREFLEAAAKRYQFWRPTDALYVIPLFLIMSVGGGLTFWRIVQEHFSNPQPLLVLGGFALFITAVAGIGFFQGRKLWQKKNAAFLEEIGRRKQDLEDG